MLRFLRDIGLIFSAILLFSTIVSAAEEITITTYYPSPYGSYNQLQSKTLGVGDNNGNGILDSGDVPNPVTRPGDVWIKGSVGIGTGTVVPAQKLHVAGNIMGAASDGTNTWRLDRLTGADPWVRLYQGSTSTYNSFAVGPFWANGATRFDLAEVTPVRKEEALEVGDVVCIDKEAKVRMRRSQKAYDPLVSGIISDPNTASMVIGGDTTPEKINSINDKKPVALVGRVLCKASAENGPIAIGDLLVTSDKPGYAMKASIDKLKPGMVLGKAMESLKNGEGKITVWITLQ